MLRALSAAAAASDDGGAPAEAVEPAAEEAAASGAEGGGASERSAEGPSEAEEVDEVAAAAATVVADAIRALPPMFVVPHAPGGVPHPQLGASLAALLRHRVHRAPPVLAEVLFGLARLHADERFGSDGQSGDDGARPPPSAAVRLLGALADGAPPLRAAVRRCWSTELRPRLTLAAPLLLPHARAVVAGVVADGRGGGDSLGDSVDGGDSESHSPATQLVSPSEAPPGGATLEPWRKRERGDDAGGATPTRAAKEARAM